MSEPINEALQQGAQDVPPDSSPGQGGQPAAEPQSATSPAPGQGEQPGQADPDSSKEPRTPDNVRGELLRKMDQRDAALDQKFARLEGMLQGIASQPAPQPSPPQQQQLTIETMTAAQLEALRPQVPEDRQGELDKLIQQRRIDESIATGIDARLSEHQARQQRVDANQTAYGRWPELHDRGSQFYSMTNRVLNERGVSNDPRALLDAANEAGMRLGLQPKAYSPAPATPGVPHGSQPPGSGGKPKGISQEEATAIAQRLRGALPAGKDFDLEAVKKLSADYEDNRGLFIRQ